MAQVLVTGGAGYIGSHIVRRLLDRGDVPVVVDDLSHGHRAAVGAARLVEADFADERVLDELLGGGRIEFVIHMAAFCQVGESMEDPASYYRNNVIRSLTLLEAARRHAVRGIVFSSSAAVYGEPECLPIAEDHPQRPTNPYGETKRAIERALGWYQRAYGTNHVSLRYFNAAGAHPAGEIGEDHEHETHLIPRLLRATGAGDEPLSIFGDDYETKDGTCVRDYVHVMDLAEAHLLALDLLRREERVGESFNLGNGAGFTVREVVAVAGEITGVRSRTRVAARRPGDPASLVASSALAMRRLGWRPAYPRLEQIVETAWNWHRRHPQGYGDGRRPPTGAAAG